MNQAINNSIIRFFSLWAIQVFVLQQVAWGWGGEVFLQLHLYPLFIMLLPINAPRSLVIFLGFLLGLFIDLIYGTYGMHAATLVFTAFTRGIILQMIEPREGYSIKDLPTKHSLGDTWFVRYTALILLFHLFFYFSIEAFTFAYIKTILLKLLISWIASVFVLLATVYITNPKA